MAGGILGLDLATRTGYAFAGLDALKAWPNAPVLTGASHGKYPAVMSGTYRNPAAGVCDTRFFGAFHRWLQGILLDHQPSVVYYEAPLPPANQRSAAAASVANGLVGLTRALCDISGVRLVKAVGNGTIKKHFAGSGHANKTQMIEAARARGWRPGDDNEADALGLLDLAIWEQWTNRKGGRS